MLTTLFPRGLDSFVLIALRQAQYEGVHRRCNQNCACEIVHRCSARVTRRVDLLVMRERLQIPPWAEAGWLWQLGWACPATGQYKPPNWRSATYLMWNKQYTYVVQILRVVQRNTWDRRVTYGQDLPSVNECGSRLGEYNGEPLKIYLECFGWSMCLVIMQTYQHLHAVDIM